jgi:hypothetical protein
MDVIGERKSFGSNASEDGDSSDDGEAIEAGPAVDVEESSVSSGIAACGSGCICGESVKMSLASEFAGLIADTMAVAGLLLPAMEIGVLTMRIVDRPGGLRPYDLRRRWRGVASGSR